MLSQLATYCIANSQLPLYHDHLGHDLVHPEHDSEQDNFWPTDSLIIRYTRVANSI